MYVSSLCFTRGMSLSLSSSPVEKAERGDFGASVDESGVCVPQDVLKAADALGARSVEHWYSFAHLFPSAVAQLLGWEREEVIQAREKLKVLLEGIVDEAILNPALPEEPENGAVPSDS